MSRARLAGAALAIWLSATALLLTNTGGHALHEGDEAIYAEFAREMVATGHFGDLEWQREVQIVRPPLSVWVLVLGRGLFSDERAVRWPLAAEAAAEVALLFLLGAALWDWRVGLCAAGVLITADLFVGYARYHESEPLLCALCVGAFLCYERARTQPRYLYGWGALLGAALMTKQVIGGLPLLAVLVDRIGRNDDQPLCWRAIARGLGVAAAVWLPWHVWALVRHGRVFVHQYFLSNVIERSRIPVLHITRPTFYLRELWRSEGFFGVVAAAAVLWLAVRALRRRQRADLLVAAWALGPFAVFTLSSSRYDHYLLLCYPALALATGALVMQLPAPPRLGLALAVAFVAAAAFAHLPRNLGGFEGEEEIRALMRVACARFQPPTRLYTYNLHPYAARYYLSLDVTTLLESAEDLRIAEARRTSQPISAEHAPDLAADLAHRARPFLLLMPRKRMDLLNGVTLEKAGETEHYVLLIGS